MSDSSPAASKPLLTLGGVVAVVVILLLVGVLLIPPVLGVHKNTGIMYQGVQMYKAIFAQVLENPETSPCLFPVRTNGFVSSTHYFQDLLDREVLRVPAAFFSGPGLPRPTDQKSSALHPSEIAWSVVVDAQDQIASSPFLLSRNFLAERIRLPGKDEPLTPDWFTEPNAIRKLQCDGEAAVIITKAGTGFILKVPKPGARKVEFNPGDHRGLILRP